MYIKHSTSVPIKFSDEFVQTVLEEHQKIVSESKNNPNREDTNDGKWNVTKNKSIPDGGCSVVNVPKKELLKALDDLSIQQTIRLKKAKLI